MNQIERMSTSRYVKSVRLFVLTLVILCIISSESVYATHIVGGDMSFSCLGNDFYEITLVIRRDCINGAEDAPFDNPASVGIFDSNGNPLNFLGSLGQVLLPFEGADTIGTSRPDCGYFGGSVCVEEATYKARVFLPFRSKGYILAYQRCCRNVTLNNIINPLESGTTKFVCLTETTLNECNSSPEFQEWPDILICANQPLTFDHEAIDVDGDSLAYKLYVPQTGASIDFPKPQRLQGPPYDSVQYSSGFSIDNLLGGEALVIDENTGLITATPNTIGQFLVGVLVEEWRDGELISKVRRDFEYNVRACEDIADISFDVEEELNCSSLSVSTINTSIDNFGFAWNFNYPSSDPQFLSNEVSPTFTYDEPGNYTISLSSTDPDDGCEVTIVKEIGVFLSELSGEIDCFISECNEELVEIVLSTNANDNNSLVSEYRWTLRTDDSRETLFGQTITKSFGCNSNVDVELIVTTENGCDLMLTKSIVLDSSSVGDDLIDIVGGEDGEVSICEGDELALLESTIEGVIYSWSPTEGLTFGDTINFSDPIASPTETTTYTVTATDGEIFDTSMVVVNVLENPTFSVASDTITICEGAIEQITINTSESNTVTWVEEEGLFIDGIYDTRNPGLRVGEDGGVFVFTVSDGMCEVTDSIVVMAIPTEVDEVEAAIDTTYSYDTTSMVLTFSINATELIETFDIVSIRWTVEAGGELFEGTGGDISVVLPETTTTARVVYYFTDSQGCEYAVIYEIVIREEDPIDPNDLIDIVGGEDGEVSICEGDELALLESTIEGVIYSWSPTEGLTFGDTINFSDPIASPTETTTYTVTATDGEIFDTSMVVVNVLENPTFSVASDTITICEGAIEQITINTSESNTVTWVEEEGLFIDGIYDTRNPGLRVGEDGGVFVFTVSDGMCEVTDSIVVMAIPTEVDEVEAAIDTTYSYDTTSMVLTFSINATELIETFDIVSIRWTVEAGGELFEGTGGDISVVLPETTTTARVVYYFTDSQGCEYAVIYEIVIREEDPIDPNDLIDIVGGEDGEVSICEGDELALLESTIEGVIYSWSPTEGLTFGDTINFSDPIASPTETTTYTVTATDGEIFDTSMVVVNVLENPTFSVASDTITICEGAIEQITINTSESNTVTWVEEEGLFIDGIYDTRNPGLRVGEDGGVFVFTVSDGMCEVTDSIVVMAIPTEVDEVEAAIDTTYSYDTTTMVLTFSINATELIETFDIVSIRWTVEAGGELFEGTGGDISVVLPETTTTARVVYYFTDSQGCEYAVIYEIVIREEDDDVLSLEFLMDERIIVCEGETSRIIANPNSEWTYTWDPEDFLVFDSEEDKSNPLFIGDTSTTYVVTVTDGVTSITDTILVDVIDDLLDLSFEKETATACFGEAVLFVQNDNHSEGSTYEWAFDSTFSNVIATEQFVTVIMPSDSVTVYVRAEDPFFCGSNIASIDVITIEPDFEFVFDSIDICVSNETVVSFVNNDPSIDFSIQWEQSENIVSALDSDMITVRSSPNTAQVELVYLISNGMGCDIRDTLIVPIDNVIIPEIETDLTGETICQVVTLSVSSQEDDATYEWSLTSDFAEIVATGSIVDISLPMVNNTVYVRASHPDYCDTTIDSIDVTTDRPDFDFDFDPINTCVSNTTELNIIDNDPSQDLNITFEENDNIVSDLNMLPLSIMANDGQEQIILRYTASNNQNCLITDSLIIDIEDELITSIDIDSSSCDGAFGIFRAMVNASEASYEWSLSEDFSSVLSTEPEIAVSLPQGQPIYLRAFTEFCESDTVSATLPEDGFMIDFDTPDRICDGDIVTITASNDSREFMITFGDSDNIVSTSDNSIVVTTIPGESLISIPYTAVSTDGCTDEGVIEIPLGEIIDPQPESMIICGTTSLSFTGGEGIMDGDILWDFGVGSTDTDQSTEANPTFDFGMSGTYTVTLMPNRSTCRFESMMIEVVVPEPIELTTDNNTIIADCSGAGSISLGVMNNLGLPVTWTNVAGDTLIVSDSLQLTSLDGVNAITATVMDDNGCSESIVFNLGTFDPDITVSFPGNPTGMAVCSGEDFEIVLMSNDSAEYNYEWSPSSAIISGQGTTSVIANLSSAQELSVLVTDPSTGCSTTITIPIDVIDIDLEVVADPDNEIFLGESVTIIANSTGDIVSYQWDNGSDAMSQIVSPEETTTYTVTITDVNGCTATGQVTITVIQPECDMTDIFIPSAFSPNNDGNNDVLFVRSNFVSEIDLQIVNRWGQEVFRSTNQRDGWNGRFGGTGKELHPDVYAYCLKVVCVDNEEYIINGTVTLIR